MADKGPASLRKFRTTDDLWKRFTEAVEESPDPEADRSKVLRQLIRWYAGEPGAELPARPSVQPDTTEEPTP